MKRAAVGAALVAILGLGGLAVAADPEGAARQYRVARRLSAEGSPQALEALRKVVELDPAGELADDALVDEAVLLGAPRWPEELGRLAPAGLSAARAPLDRTVEVFVGADRTDEARFRRALLMLEPRPGRDADAARLELLALATSRRPTAWSRSARYTLAWIAGHRGDVAAARGGLQRLLIDAPESPEARRARVSLAGFELRDGRPGDAAARLQTAIDARVDPATGAAALRSLALRRLLGDASATSPARVESGVRSFGGMSPAADGGAWIADRRAGGVSLFRFDGTAVDRWELPEVRALISPAPGRAIAADADQLWAIESGRAPMALGSLGDFTSPPAISADGSGRIWILDRRGERILVLEAGAAAPRVFVERRSARLTGLAWDGRRLVTIEGKTKSVLAIDPNDPTAVEVLPGPAFLRPTALGADRSGRVAVLDTRPMTVTEMTASGELVRTIPLKEQGIERPVAVDYGLDGSLHVFDTADGMWVRFP